MMRIVRNLEADGPAQREGDPDGRRVFRVRATAGRRIPENGRRRRTASLADGLRSLTSDESATLEAALEAAPARTERLSRQG